MAVNARTQMSGLLFMERCCCDAVRMRCTGEATGCCSAARSLSAECGAELCARRLGSVSGRLGSFDQLLVQHFLRDEPTSRGKSYDCAGTCHT